MFSRNFKRFFCHPRAKRESSFHEWIPAAQFRENMFRRNDRSMNPSLRATAKQSLSGDCGACSERISVRNLANSLLRLCLATVPPRNDNFFSVYYKLLPFCCLCGKYCLFMRPQSFWETIGRVQGSQKGSKSLRNIPHQRSPLPMVSVPRLQHP